MKSKVTNLKFEMKALAVCSCNRAIIVSDEIAGGAMGGPFGTHGYMRNAHKMFVRKPERIKSLEC